MSRRPSVLKATRKHTLTERTKSLAAFALSRKIGYLRLEDFPDSHIFQILPTQLFNPNRVLRFKNELLLVKHGQIEIWHTHHDHLVKQLEAGALFGDMPLLGQAMLGTKAISGIQGATVAVMNVEAAKEWIESDPVSIFEKLGNRLAEIETQHYRSRFQLADSRIAALLLEVAGEGSTVLGLTHEEIGERIGLYRETVTITLDAIKMDRLIEIGRKRITILDKRALRELSEL